MSSQILLLAFPITCNFHYLQFPPYHLYLHFPLLANSTQTTLLAFSITCKFHPNKFTCIFHYLQIPPKQLYWHFPLLANSTLPPLLAFSITCNFHYLQFPLLANSASPFLVVLTFTVGLGLQRLGRLYKPGPLGKREQRGAAVEMRRSTRQFLQRAISSLIVELALFD